MVTRSDHTFELQLLFALKPVNNFVSNFNFLILTLLLCPKNNKLIRSRLWFSYSSHFKKT